MPTEHTLRLQMMADVTNLTQARLMARFWHTRLVKAAEERYRIDSIVIAERHEKELNKIRAAHERAIILAADQTFALYQSGGLTVAPWSDPLWQSWVPNPEAILPNSIRVGEFIIENTPGYPTVPALISLARGCNLLITAKGMAQTRAALAFQAFYLRLLALTPPGLLRLLLLDPGGIMPNVASFMQLADYDPQLVTDKVWTEMAHIEQRTTQVIEKMMSTEDDLQISHTRIKSSQSVTTPLDIPPHLVLIALGFPDNYSLRAIENLFAIMRRGTDHGISTFLLSSTESVRNHAIMEDFYQHANVIHWSKQSFVWQHKVLKNYQFDFDMPPEAILVNRIVSSIGCLTDHRIACLPATVFQA